MQSGDLVGVCKVSGCPGREEKRAKAVRGGGRAGCAEGKFGGGLPRPPRGLSSLCEMGGEVRRSSKRKSLQQQLWEEERTQIRGIKLYQAP